MSEVPAFIKALAVFVVIFYLYCRSPAFRPLRPEWPQPRGKVRLYLVFAFIAILGNYLGIPVVRGNAIVNSRAVGATLAGLLGGPWLGLLVGVTAGAHRIIALGGAAAVAGAVATTVEGVGSGFVHLALRSRPERLMTPRVAYLTALVGEIVHMGIVLLLTHPFEDAKAVVSAIGVPMIIFNPVGAALFMTVLLSRERELDKVAAASSARALKVAERTLGLMSRGLGREVATEVADIVREETGVGAVGVTDTSRILAFSGLGMDHHRPGMLFSSPLTKRAVAENTVVVADGIHEAFACPISENCPLHSVVVVPIHVEGTVLGTVQFFEPQNRRILDVTRTLGEGLASVLSSQLLASRFQEQKRLLVEAELKVLQAQVNPHFLFNALNTIVAVTRTDPTRARELLVHLAQFFRKNLKRGSGFSTLREELDHVNAYLEIEKARLGERLHVEVDVDPSLLDIRLPTFTLQPLLENAIKHGISQRLEPGTASIRAMRNGEMILVEVEDDAGTYRPPLEGDGSGLRIVDTRIRAVVGDRYGVSVECVPQERTKVTVRVPSTGMPS